METDAHLTKLLADLPESLARDEVFVSELNNITKVVAVDKGDYLLRTGEICQDAYFINKGLFINLYVSEKGDECVTGFFRLLISFPVRYRIFYPGTFRVRDQGVGIRRTAPAITCSYRGSFPTLSVICVVLPECDADHYIEAVFHVCYPPVLYRRRIYQISLQSLHVDHAACSRQIYCPIYGNQQCVVLQAEKAHL